MVEPQPSKLMMWVRSPSPAPIVEFVDSCAHIAQSVEHFLGKEEVTGSNPVMGSTESCMYYLTARLTLYYSESGGSI